MITVTRPNYICEHCRKNYVRKHAAEWHEKHCHKNPDNKHKCFRMCVHLMRSRRCGLMSPHAYTDFICRKRDETMYSYIAERRQLQDAINDSDIRMPLECKDYQEGV